MAESCEVQFPDARSNDGCRGQDGGFSSHEVIDLDCLDGPGKTAHTSLHTGTLTGLTTEPMFSVFNNPPMDAINDPRSPPAARFVPSLWGSCQLQAATNSSQMKRDFNHEPSELKCNVLLFH